MANLILQRLVPIITAFVILLNSIGGIFGVVVIPYNPDRVEVSLGSNVISDVDEVLEHYNSAVKKTGFVLGSSGYEIIGTPVVTIKGSDNPAINMDAFWQSFEENPIYVFGIPGEGKLTASDVKSAKMSVENGKRVILISVKDYKHGLKDKNTDNPYSNAYGSSTTDFEESLTSLGMTFSSGQCEFSYTNCVISCVIDDNSGKIIYGDWDSDYTFNAKDLTMKVFDTELIFEEFSYKMGYDIDI